MSLLDDYVERFNAGVRSGEWEPILDLVAPDAELEFVGIPVGPFAGREAIGEAYRAQPPDDELVLLDRSARGARSTRRPRTRRDPPARCTSKNATAQSRESASSTSGSPAS